MASQPAPANRPRDESGKSSGDKSGNEVTCVECGEPIDTRGYIGHLRFAHDYSQESAQETWENQKGNTVAKEGDDGGSPRPNPVPTGNEISDDRIDALIERILKRYDQAGKVELVKRLANDDDTSNESEASTAEELKEWAEAAQSMRSLFQQEDSGLDAQEVAQAVASVVDNGQAPATSGGSTVEAAIGQGITDPDTLETLASLDPEKKKVEQKYEFRKNLVNGVAESFNRMADNSKDIREIFSMVGQAVGGYQDGKQGEADEHADELEPAEDRQNQPQQPTARQRSRMRAEGEEPPRAPDSPQRRRAMERMENEGGEDDDAEN